MRVPGLRLFLARAAITAGKQQHSRSPLSASLNAPLVWWIEVWDKHSCFNNHAEPFRIGKVSVLTCRRREASLVLPGNHIWDLPYLTMSLSYSPLQPRCILCDLAKHETLIGISGQKPGTSVCVFPKTTLVPFLIIYFNLTNKKYSFNQLFADEGLVQGFLPFPGYEKRIPEFILCRIDSWNISCFN